MIVRVLGEGQFDVAGEHLDEVNFLDSQLQSAADADDLPYITLQGGGYFFALPGVRSDRDYYARGLLT